MAFNEVEEPAGYPLSIGVELWRMQDTRRRTLEAVEGITKGEIDRVAAGLDNTVGAIIYHIAAIEVDWLYADILEIDYPVWLGEWFPYDVREEDGKLSPVTGFSVENHLLRMATVRDYFLEDIKRLEPTALRQLNNVEDNPSTPQWVFHHLRQHEAEHRGQIQSIRTALRNG